LLSREDYPNRVNLTPEQQKFADQFARKGSSKVRMGKLRRRLLSLALMPLTTPLAGSHSRRIRSTEFKDRSFVLGRDVAVVSLADHPAYHPTEWHFIESRVLVNVGYFDEGGTICVGGLRSQCSLRADFSKGPLMRGQCGIQCEHDGELDSPITGRLRIAGCGKFIDVCVGDHKVGYRGDTRHNTIVFRIERKLLEGSNPPAELEHAMHDLPKSGEVCEIDDVQAGDVLVKLHRKCQYYKAKFETNPETQELEPETQWPPGRILPANRTDLFKVLLAMNEFQNDVSLAERVEDKPPPVDSADWAFQAFVAFERQTVKDDDGEAVDVDPFELMKLPGWTLTQALKTDFMNAVGPQGEFQLVAEVAGTVTSIDEVPGSNHILRISLDTGKFQLVPATANLYITVDAGGIKQLEPGDVLAEGVPIGDVCQRVRYASWDQLAEVLKDNLYWMLDNFLYESCIRHGDFGWDGQEVLYDSRYVTSVLSYSATDEEGETKWYWDLRKAKQFYDSTLNAIVLPSIRYDNWKQLEVVVNGIAFDLNDPFSPQNTAVEARANNTVAAKAG
jgi:hypothetical protein